MLFYHGHGARDYHRDPQPLRRRLHWECAAIISGHAAPLFAQGLADDESPALWIFPPQQLHGWGSRHRGGCHICTVHLSALPRVLANAVEQQGWLHFPLIGSERRILGRLNRRLTKLLAQRGDVGEVAADLARGEIGCLALPHLKPCPPASDDQAQRLKQALAWLDAHLHEGVGVDDAAQAIALSPAHLRRIAHAVAGRAPRELLNELRLERARDLLRQTTDNLSSIAWACGYADDVALSNAFLRRHGQRPGQWRRSSDPE